MTTPSIGIHVGIPAGLYLADTSAIARIHHDPVRAELTRLGKAGLLATCVVVDLEVLYSARDPAEYARTATLRAAGFTDLPPIPQIAYRARQIQAMLLAAASIVRPDVPASSPPPSPNTTAPSSCTTTPTSTTSPPSPACKPAGSSHAGRWHKAL